MSRPTSSGAESERYAILGRPTTGDGIGAFLTVLIALAGVAAAAPVAHEVIGPNPGLVSLLCTWLTLGAVCCAGLLAALYRVSAREPLAFLALTFGLGAIVIALYLLALPGVLSPSGSLGGSATAEWLWVFAHAGFVLLALAYACSERLALHGGNDERTASRRVALRVAVALVVLALCATTASALAGADSFPLLVVGNAFTPLLAHHIAPALVVGYAIALALLYALTRFRTITQLWVGVVLVVLAYEVIVSGILANARYSLSWYAGCFEGVVAVGAFLNLMARQVNSMLFSFAERNRVLADRSVRDALTHLLNRRGFDERMAELTSAHRRQRTSSLALAIVDIDHFKAVNDTYGHVAGDRVLRAVAGAIQSACSRSPDACYRLGGEEFAVVLPATDAAGAVVVADRIRDRVARLNIASGANVPGAYVTVSIGIAVSEGPAEIDSRALYERADATLLAAKRAGRDRVAVFDEEFQSV